MKKLALLPLVSALALSLPAQAADWTLTFSATGPIWGGDTAPPPELTLHLVTEDVLSTSTASQSLGEGYRIISFTGTRSGESILPVLTTPAGDSFFSYGLDSYLYASTPELISLQGLGYTTADGTRYNLYGATTNLGGTPDTQWFEMTSLPSTSEYAPFVTFQGALSVSAAAPVPEPGTWALMLAGGMLVGGWRRRRGA